MQRQRHGPRPVGHGTFSRRAPWPASPQALRLRKRNRRGINRAPGAEVETAPRGISLLDGPVSGLVEWTRRLPMNEFIVACRLGAGMARPRTLTVAGAAQD